MVTRSKKTVQFNLRGSRTVSETHCMYPSAVCLAFAGYVRFRPRDGRGPETCRTARTPTRSSNDVGMGSWRWFAGNFRFPQAWPLLSPPLARPPSPAARPPVVYSGPRLFAGLGGGWEEGCVWEGGEV